LSVSLQKRSVCLAVPRYIYRIYDVRYCYLQRLVALQQWLQCMLFRQIKLCIIKTMYHVDVSNGTCKQEQDDWHYELDRQAVWPGLLDLTDSPVSLSHSNLQEDQISVRPKQRQYFFIPTAVSD